MQNKSRRGDNSPETRHAQPKVNKDGLLESSLLKVDPITRKHEQEQHSLESGEFSRNSLTALMRMIYSAWGGDRQAAEKVREKTEVLRSAMAAYDQMPDELKMDETINHRSLIQSKKTGEELLSRVEKVGFEFQVRESFANSALSYDWENIARMVQAVSNTLDDN
jgi:hypothetical protein